MATVKKQKDYSKGKIYMIRNTENDKLYIGSTCQTLSQRMAKHRNSAKDDRSTHYPLYVAFNEIGVSKFYIELLEDFPCERQEQLLKREGELIRLHESHANGYNSKVAARTFQEWRQDNYASQSQKWKGYYQENKDKVKEKVSEWVKANKEKHEKYKAEYYQKNKDMVLQKQKERLARKKAEKQASTST